MMNKLMLSCQTATELTEKNLREELSFVKKMQLFFHTSMCNACRQYTKQSHLIERLFKAKEKTINTPNGKKSSKELEEKILLQLNGQQK